MFSALAKSVVAGAALSLAFAAVAPQAAQAAEKSPLVMTEGEAAAAEGGGKVWFAFMWPDNLKPQLEEKKMLLTLVGLAPWGSIWGPIVLLGQGFDMEWALPSLIWHSIFVIWIWFPYIGWTLGWIGYFIMAWIATQTMFANLNRPEIQIGGGDAPAGG